MTVPVCCQMKSQHYSSSVWIPPTQVNSTSRPLERPWCFQSLSLWLTLWQTCGTVCPLACANPLRFNSGRLRQRHLHGIPAKPNHWPSTTISTLSTPAFSSTLSVKRMANLPFHTWKSPSPRWCLYKRNYRKNNTQSPRFSVAPPPCPQACSRQHISLTCLDFLWNHQEGTPTENIHLLNRNAQRSQLHCLMYETLQNLPTEV